jgi:hypothetical protein
MATTINAANISIGMDIGKLKEGMGATRTEISQLRSILKDSVDPVDKLKNEMDLLRRAFDAGAIDANQFARSMDHLKTKLGEVDAKAKGQGISGLLSGQLGKIAGIAGGAFTVSKIFGDVEKLDSINDKAEQLGISFKDLLVVGRTFEETGGLSFDQAGQALSKMQVNLANARDKGGDLEIMLKRVGLSSRELANMDAVTAFQKINQSFSQIGNQADKMQFATELFGKAGIDMVPALSISADKFSEMRQHLESVGLLADDLPGKISKTSDEIQRMNDILLGAAPEIVRFFEPVFDSVKSLTDLAKNLRRITAGETIGNNVAGMNELGIKFNTNEIANMTKEQREAFENETAKRLADWHRQKKQTEEKAAKEKEIQEGMDNLIDRMDAKIIKLKEEAKQREKEQAAEEEKNRKLSNQIDSNLVRGIERDMGGLESERQRLLGAGNQNVAATIAPAIRAGTVEAYKAINKQNEDRVARQENIRKLDEIKTELQKLNSERAVILSRIR